MDSPLSENIQRVFIKCALKFIVSAWNYLSKFAILFLYTKSPLVHGPLKQRAVSQGIEFRREFMSVRSAARFLSAAAQDGQVRDRFAGVDSPEEFLQVSQCMGYTFTTAELLRLVRVKSLKNETRRITGVWKWLRGVNWR
jgi:hypothetical protein